jgi:hypothetical protein
VSESSQAVVGAFHPEQRVVITGEPVIGRDRELERIGLALERAAASVSQLVLIEGSPEMGKASLLRAAAEVAARQGFRVLPHPGRWLAVTPETTEASFSREVAAQDPGFELETAVPTPVESSGSAGSAASELEAMRGELRLPDAQLRPTLPVLAHAAALRATDDKSLPATPQDVVQAAAPVGKLVVDVLARSLDHVLPGARLALGIDNTSLLHLWNRLGVVSLLDTSLGRRAPHRLAQYLADGPPTLVCIKGWRPSNTFATWFVSTLLADLRATDAPVVLLLADQAGRFTALRPHADQSLHLGPLSRAPVRQHFARLDVRPRIRGKELTQYVDASCAQPHLLWRLTRVLQSNALATE